MPRSAQKQPLPRGKAMFNPYVHCYLACPSVHDQSLTMSGMLGFAIEKTPSSMTTGSQCQLRFFTTSSLCVSTCYVKPRSWFLRNLPQVQPGQYLVNTQL